MGRGGDGDDPCLIERPVSRLLQAQQLRRRGNCQRLGAHFGRHPGRVAVAATLARRGTQLAVARIGSGGNEGRQLVGEDELAVLDEVLRHYSLNYVIRKLNSTLTEESIF